jgi:ABC-type multidrug transport system fused ATPase/permease subunit
MKKQKPPLLRILSYYSPLKRRLIFVLILGSVGIFLYSLMPQYTSKSIEMIDKAIPMRAEIKGIVAQLAIFLGLCLANEIFSVICMFTILNTEHGIVTEQTVTLKRKLDVVPVSYLDNFSTGDLTRRVCATVSELFKETLQIIYSATRVSFFFITTLIAMYSIEPILATVVFLSLPLCVITAKIVSGLTQKLYAKNVSADNDIYNFVDERTTLHGFFVANGLDGDNSSFAKVNGAKGIIGEDTAVALNTTYITFIQNFMYLIVTVIFGVLILTGNLSDAEFMLLPTFLIYSQRFLSNSTVVTSVTNVLQRVKSRAKFFFEIIDYAENVTAHEDTVIKKVSGDIVFTNVSAAATPFKEDAINNASFTIPFGSTVAFVGENDGGQEKIADLITKLAMPTAGIISVDGIDLSRINSKSYYNRIGIAFERPFIFSGTVAENLLYGIRRTLPEHVIEVAQKLGFHDFIAALPNGYETKLFENTIMLSNPEKQGINVARTILQSPDILILNDALREFDLLSEQKINNVIIKEYTDRTRIFVTKRLATITNVDHIYFCDNGQIVEHGTHAELMVQGGAYYKAYTSN